MNNREICLKANAEIQEILDKYGLSYFRDGNHLSLCPKNGFLSEHEICKNIILDPAKDFQNLKNILLEAKEKWLEEEWIKEDEN